MTGMKPESRMWFWAVWAALSLATVFLGGLVGPFVGLNAVYRPGPSQPMTETQSYAVGAAGAALVGIVLGGMAWFLLARFRTHRKASGFAILIAFSLATVVSSGAYFAAGLALYVGLIPLVGVSLLLWAASLTVLILSPRLMRTKPSP